jgi:hypothetical protein
MGGDDFSIEMRPYELYGLAMGLSSFCLHRRSGVGEQQQEEDETADEARHSIFCDHGRTPRITRLAHYVGVRDIPKELRVQIYSWPESGVLLGFYTYELGSLETFPVASIELYL